MLVDGIATSIDSRLRRPMKWATKREWERDAYRSDRAYRRGQQADWTFARSREKEPDEGHRDLGPIEDARGPQFMLDCFIVHEACA